MGARSDQTKFRKLEEVNTIRGANLKPIVAEVVAHNTTADLYEHMLNPYLKRIIVDDGGLIMSRADVLGPVAKFAALVVAPSRQASYPLLKFSSRRLLTT
jgi:hypothetical protein